MVKLSKVSPNPAVRSGGIPNKVRDAPFEWIHWRDYLNVAEFAKKKSGDGARETMVAIETSGSLKYADAFDPIALDPNQLAQEKLPYYLKDRKIREIVYGADGICGGNQSLL